MPSTAAHTAADLQVSVTDYDTLTETHKQPKPEVDPDLLAAQLRDLQRQSERFLAKHRLHDSYASSSSTGSDEESDVVGTPALASSGVSTPAGDVVPRTPSNLSTLTTYFPTSPTGKPLSGSGRLRSPSPLAAGEVKTSDLQVPAAIAEEEPRSISPHGNAQATSASSVYSEHRQPEVHQPDFQEQGPNSVERKHRPRSASLSVIQKASTSNRRVVRRSSFGDLPRSNALVDWFNARTPERRLELPGRPALVRPGQNQRDLPKDEIEVIGADGLPVSTETKAKRKKLQKKGGPPAHGSDGLSSSSQESRGSLWSQAKESFVATYCPSEAPPLILPSGPTDLEKTLYLKTNRLGLYTFGVFSFLSLSVGMWLFVISFNAFYWFGAVVFLLQIYLLISYTVSICGKDYDIKKHHKILEENLIDPLTCSTVDIYLPCCKEPIEVLENTYKYVQQLQYPTTKLKVYVLDDGASDAVKTMAQTYGYNYICREDRPRLKKAGNLRWAFARTEGDFFAIFDADFCPRPDFLSEIIPIHLAKPDTAIVQTPQFFRTSTDQSWVEQGAGAVQELFYRVVQINRNRFGASICVGSNAVYRRSALEEVGGTAEIGFSEDVHTGFYAVNRGWKVRYLPLCLACGICPDTPRAFFSQQMRWCMGSTTLLTNMDFWRSKLNPIQKICYLSGMMYYSAISLSIFMNPLPGILMLWCRPQYVRYYNLAFAVPSIVYSIIAIRCWSKARYGFAVQFVMVIQSYAYLTAIKDRLFGRALAWVPSGDTKAHKNNKYRNMRILAWCWMMSVMGAVIAGTTYQVLRGLPWYDCLPLIILDAFNLFLAHRFLLWSGRI
ncbi:Cellulose synthase catalytic subunit [UDP-forming] [Fulvia fulva]|uniref:Cellulose synthase catalytic subunit [UDP-forming] n=1 Tax=Passalora fulva TaxID=5499 RepID=A0A9Q8LAV0_PASFU|nr:Cellulose synthase catalytic subunit [UDP-forming] [Fulvia fulva]UJO13869.1 Cellulose synthase catalytic subunit [UDP-forming] [Fulvia fulva]